MTAIAERARRRPELLAEPASDGPGPPGPRRPRHHRPRQPRAAAPHPRAHAGRERVPEPLRHPGALAAPPRAPVRLPGPRRGVPRRLPARRIRHRDVRRQLQLARPDLDADERAPHPSAAALLRVLRRHVQGGVPDRLGPGDEPLRGRARDRRAAWSRIFLRDASGRRPVFGGAEKFQTDPHWRDHILFYEYFHGDNGAGIGASHQTGWTARGDARRVIRQCRRRAVSRWERKRPSRGEGPASRPCGS